MYECHFNPIDSFVLHWNFISFNYIGNASDYLSSASVTIMTTSNCIAATSGYTLSSGQMCGSFTAGKDTCADAGAPVFCSGRSLVYTGTAGTGATEQVLVGMDSIKLGECNSGNAAIFTNITYYLEFLVGYVPPTTTSTTRITTPTTATPEGWFKL